jgi:CheY-like chemotaxis protein
MFNEHEYSLIIMDGLAAAREIGHKNSTILIIALTANVIIEDSRLYENTFLTKPLNSTLLATEIDKVLYNEG